MRKALVIIEAADIPGLLSGMNDPTHRNESAAENSEATSCAVLQARSAKMNISGRENMQQVKDRQDREARIRQRAHKLEGRPEG
jgi:hypothetical protein